MTYIDNAGREFEQPASLVITSLFAINNIRMLLLSGIGKPCHGAHGEGVVGKPDADIAAATAYHASLE